MIRHGVMVVLLTLLTQVGGVAWLLALGLRTLFGRLWLMFLICYVALSITANYTAPLMGRVALPCLDAGPSQIAVLNPLYCALNRHYVSPEVKEHVDGLSAHMHSVYPGTRTRALDGNFPFLDGFPLLPHLSHDDGDKIDLAFYYQDTSGAYSLGKAKWFLGYWGYVQPRAGDPQPCADETGLSLRWDMGWLQSRLKDLTLDEQRTGEMLRWLASSPVGNNYKILLEPHLKERLGLQSDLIRFQGCLAARHDDHIHLQFQP